MTPFHGGNKVRPRINVTTGKKTFNWLFDTGAAITCMNANSFREAFSGKRPKLLHKGTSLKEIDEKFQDQVKKGYIEKIDIKKEKSFMTFKTRSTTGEDENGKNKLLNTL